MITADSSVLIARMQPGHPFHEAARSAMDGEQLRLIAHTAAETFNALTGRRGRVLPATVVGALRRIDPDPLVLSGPGYFAAMQRCAERGIVGGAVYDALIAATAREAGARLVSLDQRAAPTYAAIGADVVLLDT